MKRPLATVITSIGLTLCGLATLVDSVNAQAAELASVDELFECPVVGGVSILSCGSCIGDEYTTITSHEVSMPCPKPEYTGSLVIRWDEEWEYVETCEAIGNGQCGQSLTCDPVLGWLVGHSDGPFTEEVAIMNSTKVAEFNHTLENRCVPVKPLGPQGMPHLW